MSIERQVHIEVRKVIEQHAGASSGQKCAEATSGAMAAIVEFACERGTTDLALVRDRLQVAMDSFLLQMAHRLDVPVAIREGKHRG